MFNPWIVGLLIDQTKSNNYRQLQLLNFESTGACAHRHTRAHTRPHRHITLALVVIESDGEKVGESAGLGRLGILSWLSRVTEFPHVRMGQKSEGGNL